MATVYRSLQMGGGTVGTAVQNAPYPVSGPGIGGRSIKCERGIFTLSAALILNDTVLMFRLHPRFRVTGGLLKADDLDTNGSPAIVLALGDAGDDDRYFTASTVAQTGTFTTTLAATGIDYLTTAYTDVYLKVTTAPATGTTTGTVTANLYGYIEEPA